MLGVRSPRLTHSKKKQNQTHVLPSKGQMLAGQTHALLISLNNCPTTESLCS